MPPLERGETMSMEYYGVEGANTDDGSVDLNGDLVPDAKLDDDGTLGSLQGDVVPNADFIEDDLFAQAGGDPNSQITAGAAPGGLAPTGSAAAPGFEPPIDQQIDLPDSVDDQTNILESIIDRIQDALGSIGDAIGGVLSSDD